MRLQKMLFAIFKKYVKVTATHSGNSQGIQAVSTHAPQLLIVLHHEIFFAGAKPVGIGLFSAS
jgi:hypothetical protein